MNSSRDDGFDAFDEILPTDFDLPELDAGVREAHFRASLAVLRRRRAARAILRAAGWVLMFGLGFVAAKLEGFGGNGAGDAARHAGGDWIAASDGESGGRTDTGSRPVAAGATHQSGAAMSNDESDAAPGDPAELERLSETVTNEEREDLLRRAGDLYLAENADVRSAMRCYRQLLDDSGVEGKETSARTRRVHPTDSWLLIQMKRDRLGSG